MRASGAFGHSVAHVAARFCQAIAKTALGLFVLTLGLFVLTSCGRRASRADCRLIVDKSVDLQLKAMDLTDEQAILKREEQVRDELQAEIDSCEGRRITARTMKCVQASSSIRELDECLR
jgi:hypothetical protein